MFLPQNLKKYQENPLNFVLNLTTMLKSFFVVVIRRCFVVNTDRTPLIWCCRLMLYIGRCMSTGTRFSRLQGEVVVVSTVACKQKLSKESLSYIVIENLLCLDIVLSLSYVSVPQWATVRFQIVPKPFRTGELFYMSSVSIKWCCSFRAKTTVCFINIRFHCSVLK